MNRLKVTAVIALVAVLLGSILIVRAPTALAAVGPKTITVDGDPSDWTGATPATANTGAESSGEFVWNDTVGDDTGDGDYTYPMSTDLNRTGLFDLTEVRIAADATNLYVLIKIQNLSNTWLGSDGFSTVAAVLLIDTTQDTGGQLTARPNVNISSGSGWEYWAKVAQTGWHSENAKVFDRAGDWAPIVNKADPAFNSIEASIPLAFIGKDGTTVNGATWRFMLFLGGFDGGGPNGFRDVRLERWGEPWAFGGGTNTSYDPQVVDIAFSASQGAQEAELGSYSGTSYATMASFADVTFGALGFVADTAPPTLTALAQVPTFNSVTITWNTDEVANTTVEWGTVSGSYPNKASKDEFVTSHSVTLTGLTEQTTYYYRVLSADIANNEATSLERQFTTPAAPPSNIASWVGNTFSWKDRTGDDVGDGNYVYPLTNLVDWVGRADLSWLNMSRTATALHINAKLNANVEHEWRQRMGTLAIFIDQDHVTGSGGRSVGIIGSGAEASDPHPMNLSVAANFAFEYLVVVDFENRSEVGDVSGVGEMFIFNHTWNAAQGRWSLIYLSTAPSISPEPDAGQVYAHNSNEVDVWLNFSVFGTSDNWTFVAASMLFDDAARPFDQGGIRQVRPTPSDWIGGGSNGPFNPNVYDAAFYPDTASQSTDLSNYTAGRYANLTRGVQINFGTKWHQLVRAAPITHSYAATASVAPTSLRNNETATVTATFTDKGVGVPNAQVSISRSPIAAGTIVGSEIQTTDANGRVTFTFRAGSVTSDTTVTFTLSATNDTATAATTTTTVTVLAPTTTTPPAGGIDPLVLGGIGVLALIVVVAAVMLVLRRRKGAGGGGSGGPPT